MGLLKGVAVGLLVLIVVALGLVAWRLDRIAARLIEDQGTEALGVRTSVGLVFLGLLPPSLRLSGFEIANPEGFREKNFFSMGAFRVAPDLGSVLEETVVVRHIRVRDVDVAIERGLRRSNYGVILGNLKRAGSGKPPPQDAGPRRRYRVDEIRIQDVTARLHLSAGIAGAAATEVRIPEILLTNVGSETGSRAITARVMNSILTAVLQALVSQGKLPPQLAGDLRANLRGLERVPYEVSGEVVRIGGERAGEALDEARDLVEGAGEKARDELQKLIPGRRRGE